MNSTGAEILIKLGHIGQGDPAAIAALERSARGNIAQTSSTASNALLYLAKNGDPLAIAAWEKYCTYREEQQRLDREESQRLAVKREADEAKKWGLTIDELREQKRLVKEAHAAKVLDNQSKQQYEDSKFQSGQTVVCLIEGWQYTGQLGVVERAIHSKFVEVRFSDRYLTIQGDNKFRLVDNSGE